MMALELFGIIVTILLCLICVWLIWMAWKRIQLCKVLSSIPVPLTPWPIFGHALQMKRDPHEFYIQIRSWMENLREKGLTCVWIGPKPFIGIFKAEFVEILLSSQKNITKMPLYTFLHPWFGEGLLTSAGSKWKSRRRLLTPAFHFKILNGFVSVYQKQSAVLVQLLQAKAGKGEFNIVPYITHCVLDIICETSMGFDIKSQFGRNSEYTEAVLSMSELVQERQKSPWLWPDLIYNMTSSGKKHRKNLNILHDFTNKVINKRIQQRKTQKSGNPCSSDTTALYSPSNRPIRAFLDLLLEEYDQSYLTKKDVREEVDTFMFEGHDTTSASLQWTIHLLGHHPDILSRLQTEVDEFFECLPNDGNIKPDQLKDLNFLECVIKEALRLFPSVPLIGRELTEECKFGPHLVPKGCSVIVGPMALHRDPEVWDEPDVFNPDRFLPENNIGRNPYAYIPFSAGPRNCIGQKFALMEEKVVLATILHHFNIKSTQATDDIKISTELVLKSINGIMVKLETRTI
ncbi:cytochrome P450 4V2-like isoform X1 [Dendronephthya gigantea]|uniref:cytochrome P450 4V2-like isoform X1 n=2 Tax=Dendronephthya gigantea TaxID=151771 RepID=UPI00106A2437|nr:cytochrome P450 4V2-like isoform X1 [Dendronephthya gigantea]XP_028416578.1 cytochrome P450 4V2-like isoform X1 [Dendronephthya gigantea]